MLAIKEDPASNSHHQLKQEKTQTQQIVGRKLKNPVSAGPQTDEILLRSMDFSVRGHKYGDSSGGPGQFWNLEFYVSKAENLGFYFGFGGRSATHLGPRSYPSQSSNVMKGEAGGYLCGVCSAKSRVGTEQSGLLPLLCCGLPLPSAEELMNPGSRKPWLSCHTAPEPWLLERSVVVAAAAAVTSCLLPFTWGHGILG